MNELFDLAPSLSPRLLWMREHGVITASLWDGFEQRDRVGAWQKGSKDGNGIPRTLVYGDTEDEAIAALATKLNLRLWNEPSHPPK